MPGELASVLLEDACFESVTSEGTAKLILHSAIAR